MRRRLGLLPRTLNLGDVVIEHQIAGALAVNDERHHQDLDVHEAPVLARAPCDPVREALLVGLPLDFPAFL